MHNDGISYRIFTVCNTILLILLSLLFAYPVLYVLFASLSDSNKLMGHMGLLLQDCLIQLGDAPPKGDVKAEALRQRLRRPGVMARMR